MKKRIFFFLTLVLLPVSLWAASPIILGRAPQLSPEVSSREWGPLVDYLSTALGQDVQLRVYARRDDFEYDLKQGVLDLYFGNPAYGVIGSLKHGYVPLVRSNKKLLEGIIVVRKDSGIDRLARLNRKRIAFPSQTAFAATLYLQQQLKSDSDIVYEPLYMGTHDNVYRAVAIGRVDAGAGVERTLNREAAALREQLTILYRTPGVSPHPLMAHPRLSTATQEKIRQAVLHLATTEKGQALLARIKMREPINADYARDYQSLEKMVREMYRELLL